MSRPNDPISINKGIECMMIIFVTTNINVIGRFLKIMENNYYGKDRLRYQAF